MDFLEPDFELYKHINVILPILCLLETDLGDCGLLGHVNNGWWYFVTKLVLLAGSERTELVVDVLE